MYLNQIAVWQIAKRNENNELLRNKYGAFEYTASTSKVRKQAHVEEIKDKNGRTLVTRHIIYTCDNVHVDDIIDGEIVLIVDDMVSLTGKTIMKRVIT